MSLEDMTLEDMTLIILVEMWKLILCLLQMFYTGKVMFPAVCFVFRNLQHK